MLVVVVILVLFAFFLFSVSTFFTFTYPLNCGGPWVTTDDSFLHFLSVLHCPKLGPGGLKACTSPDVVFPPLLLLLLSTEWPQSSSWLFCCYHVCWVCLCCHNLLNSDMDYRIFIMCTDVSACDCTLGCMDTERESALQADSVKKIPCCIMVSNLCQQHDGPC